jgi:hypothetical protein
VKAVTRRVELRASVIGLAILWHIWLSPRFVELLFGVTPYLLLVFAWNFIGRVWLILPTLAVVAWSDATVFVQAKHAARTSSTAGVAIGMQFLFACLVVGVAVVIAWVLPTRRTPSARRRN